MQIHPQKCSERLHFREHYTASQDEFYLDAAKVVLVMDTYSSIPAARRLVAPHAE